MMDEQNASISAYESLESDEYDESLEPTLKKLFSNDSLEWIFVGGKGGVGKTTTACSIAVELSKRRKDVLVLSTDPAHNLSDTFGQKFSGTATKVNGFNNLYAMEIDTNRIEALEYRLNKRGNLLDSIPDLLQTFPGFEEALALADLMQSVQTMNYSVIVFDTAPTGHTLRLLNFPNLMEKGLKAISSLSNQLSSTLNVFSAFTGKSMEEDDFSSILSFLKALASSVREKFQDSDKATFVCVCIPEFLSVYETERLILELFKRGIDCENIVVNQVLFPIEEINDEIPVINDLENEDEELSEEKVIKSKPYRILKAQHDALQRNYTARRKIQSKYLQQVKDLYGEDYHVVCMPQMTEEIRGMDKLNAFSSKFLECRLLPILK